MTRKSMLLFLLVCLMAGAATFLGSVIGHFFGKGGLYTGAIIGGIAGVVAATRIAVNRRILGPKRFWGATIGGVLGLILAAEIATRNMSTPGHSAGEYPLDRTRGYLRCWLAARQIYR